jgi:hypothetical protein
MTLGTSGTLLTSEFERSGTAPDAGTDVCFGAAGCVGAAGRFGAALAFGAVGRVGPVAELWDAARGGDAFRILGRDALGFGGLCLVGVGRGALARTFVPAAAFLEAAALRARACSAACAALAFFFACLAAFLLAFANFRARLSTVLAARTCCFAASARVTAVVASAFSRCAAIAPFVRVSVE